MKKTLLLLVPFLFMFGCSSGGIDGPSRPGDDSSGIPGGGSPGANLASITISFPPTQGAQNALIDTGTFDPNTARIVVRKLEDVGYDYQPTRTVCTWEIPQYCDISDPANPVDFECIACAIPSATCILNASYAAEGSPDSECFTLPDGDPVHVPVWQTTYKKIVDGILYTATTSEITITVPPSAADTELYTLEVFTYIAGNYLEGQTPCDIQEATCEFIPVTSCPDPTGPCPTVPTLVAADLHILADYWEGDKSGETQFMIDPGPNTVNITLIPLATLSLPAEVNAGHDYDVAANMAGALRTNWYVRQTVGTGMDNDIFIRGGSDLGISMVGGTNPITITAPEWGGDTAAAGTLYHHGQFFLVNDLLKTGESFEEWTFGTSDAGPINPMGSIIITP